MFTPWRLLLLALVVASSPLQADEVLMKNGSILKGTVVSAEGGQVVFDTPFAGEITLNAENIERVTTVNPVTLKMNDGTILRDRQLVSTDEGTRAKDAAGTLDFFNPGEIAFVNPEPWLLGEGYKWFGDVNVALVSERGNTDTDEWDGDFESVWRSLPDRYILRGSYERDEANGEKNKNQWNLRAKYDRFRKEKPDDYYGVQIAFAYDEFADLDLRTAIGPYVGRQFFSSSYLSLSGEVGIVYVDEQFDVAEDNDFWGSNWEFKATTELFPWLNLYAEQIGVLNFDEFDELLVDTKVGVSFPTVMGIKSSLEALWEYDGGAVEGVDDTDETYSFKLGYEW